MKSPESGRTFDVGAAIVSGLTFIIVSSLLGDQHAFVGGAIVTAVWLAVVYLVRHRS